jgi:hypothetical protein
MQILFLNFLQTFLNAETRRFFSIWAVVGVIQHAERTDRMEKRRLLLFDNLRLILIYSFTYLRKFI